LELVKFVAHIQHSYVAILT